MKIIDRLNSRKVTLSFEIFPPKKRDGFDGVRAAAMELTALRPDFISITCGAGGTTRGNTAELAQAVEGAGTAALAHLTCVRQSRESIDAAVEEYRSRGIRNVLALRGDVPQDAADGEDVFPSGLRHASDLVPVLKEAGFCVGGACYPESHPESRSRDADIDLLKRKVDAGVDFLTTQMFFDNDMLYSFLYRLQSAGIRVPVVAGIMPITNASQVSRMVELSNAYIPRKLLAICDRFRDSPGAMRQAGIAYATDQIIDLISNGVRGIHIYTMNRPDTARAIVGNVNKIVSTVNGE